MQVLEQHGGAGPSDRQKAGMVGESLRLVPQRMANDPGCGSRASDPQGTSEEGRQARLTRPSKIHFHLIWRSNLSQTIAFALLLAGILLITHFRNGTEVTTQPRKFSGSLRFCNSSGLPSLAGQFFEMSARSRCAREEPGLRPAVIPR